MFHCDPYEFVKHKCVISSENLNNNSHIQLLSEFLPDFRITNHLVPRVFGYISSVHVHPNLRGKLDPRAIKCIFIGY